MRGFLFAKISVQKYPKSVDSVILIVSRRKTHAKTTEIFHI